MSTTILVDIFDAHGGLDRWREFSRIEASIVTQGALWGIKGLVQDAAPRRMTVWLHEERASVTPFGAADWKTDFTPDRMAIEALPGVLVSEREAPRAAFDGHVEGTAWDPLHRAYFNGYAMWTYLKTPFLFADPGVETELLPVHDGEDGPWQVVRAHFPSSIATHCAVQDFLLRLRHAAAAARLSPRRCRRTGSGTIDLGLSGR